MDTIVPFSFDNGLWSVQEGKGRSLDRTWREDQRQAFTPASQLDGQPRHAGLLLGLAFGLRRERVQGAGSSCHRLRAHAYIGAPVSMRLWHSESWIACEPVQPSDYITAMGSGRDIAEGRGWCVDLDLEKSFDRVNHGKLMRQIAQRVEDKRLLKLIRACFEPKNGS